MKLDLGDHINVLTLGGNELDLILAQRVNAGLPRRIYSLLLNDRLRLFDRIFQQFQRLIHANRNYT
jgi:hypothetical protein